MKPILFRQAQGLTVAAGQQFRLALFPVAIDRPDGMNHVTGLQSIAFRDLGLAGRAAVQATAFGQEPRPGGPMDRAVDPAAAQQAVVGCVNDGVDIQCRDVGLQDGDVGMHDFYDIMIIRDSKDMESFRNIDCETNNQ